MNNLSIKNNSMMSSLEIVKLTGKQKNHIHRDIRDLVNSLDDPFLDHVEYQEIKDKRGYAKEMLINFDLTMLLITGYDANARMKIIQRWKELEQKEFDRKNIDRLTQEKRSAHIPMMNALIEHREDLGKETKTHHFIIENKLCNWSVTGSFEAIDESQLTVDDMQLLTYARRTNESLIIAGLDYDERKRLLAYKVENKRRKIQKLLSN